MGIAQTCETHEYQSECRQVDLYHGLSARQTAIRGRSKITCNRLWMRQSTNAAHEDTTVGNITDRLNSGRHNWLRTRLRRRQTMADLLCVYRFEKQSRNTTRKPQNQVNKPTRTSHVLATCVPSLSHKISRSVRIMIQRMRSIQRQ